MIFPRTFDIEQINADQVPDTWKSVDPQRTIKSAIACNFGFGEEVIGYLWYTDDTFEVGVGEPMADPEYVRLYKGNDPRQASEVFVIAILRGAMNDEDHPSKLIDKILKLFDQTQKHKLN